MYIIEEVHITLHYHDLNEYTLSTRHRTDIIVHYATRVHTMTSYSNLCSALKMFV